MAMLLLLLAVVLTACGQGPVSPPDDGGGGHPQLPDGSPAYVVFAPAVSYARALREVTDLGAQPGFMCGVDVLWQPMGQRAAYAGTHGIFVWYGPITIHLLGYAAQGLATAPGVLRTEEGARVEGMPGDPQPSPGVPVYKCPPVNGATYTSATPLPIGVPYPEQAGMIVRVTFSAPLDTYDQALAAVSDLGLGLVDPCVLQAVVSGKTSTPHLAGQEESFAATQTLTLATNAYLTSSLWQQQLAAMPGVAHIEAPYAAHC